MLGVTCTWVTKRSFWKEKDPRTPALSFVGVGCEESPQVQREEINSSKLLKPKGLTLVYTLKEVTFP